MQHKFSFYFLFFIYAALFYISCSKLPTPYAIFRKQSPHDTYGQRLKDAGLNRSAIGNKWLLIADESLPQGLSITLPYKETGYFGADKVQTSVLSFNARQGQKIHIILTKKPADFKIFIDLFQVVETRQFKVVAFADTSGLKLDFEIPKTGKYLIRLQPELLQSGEYTLIIASGPSLGFPVSSSGKPHIESFFGDSRDEGGRRHEGVDIFAPKGTPALAAASGVITGVGENKLGGLVVFMRPDDADYTLYYAHLEIQLVHEGQQVKIGDTVGLIDNTGNAKNTPTHLHFGIYTPGGAVDPLPFINHTIVNPKNIGVPLNFLSLIVSTSVASSLLNAPAATGLLIKKLTLHTPLTVNAATGNWFKVTLPDGTAGFLPGNDVAAINTLRRFTLKHTTPLFDSPDSTLAAGKSILTAGESVNLKGAFKNYYLVEDKGLSGWVSD